MGCEGCKSGGRRTQRSASAHALHVTAQLATFFNHELAVAHFARDLAGRVNGIILLPPNGRAANLAFGGPNLDTLYLTAGDKVWKRQLQVKGVRPADAPLKPENPRL